MGWGAGVRGHCHPSLMERNQPVVISGITHGWYCRIRRGLDSGAGRGIAGLGVRGAQLGVRTIRFMDRNEPLFVAGITHG